MACNNRKCLMCGSEFYANQSRINKGHGLFCCRRCRSDNQVLTGELKGKNNAAYKGLIDKRCTYCDKSFQVYPSNAGRGQGKFCSVKCRAKSVAQKTNKKVEVICNGCSKSIWASPSRADRVKYCSKECLLISKRKDKGNPWPLLKSVKKDEIKTCPQCKETFIKGWKYCSKKCQITAKNKRTYTPRPESMITRPCLSCGVNISVRLCVYNKGQGKFCNMTCFGRWQSSHPSTTHPHRGKGGKREDLDNRYFRSSWEANYARYLNFKIKVKQIKSWEYEPETFDFEGIKRGARFYTPDFKVTLPDGTIEYHEVKGWMDATSKTKLKRMAKYHPSIKIILIDAPVYRLIGKECRNFIPNWEREAKKCY